MFHFSKDVLLKNLIFDPFALDNKFYINGTSNIIRTSNGANKLARLEKYKLDARTAQFLLWFDRASSTSQMASIILRIRCRNIRIMWICGRLFVSADGSLVKIITKKASVSRIYLHRTRKVQRKKKGIKIPRSLFHCAFNTETVRRVDCGGISPYIYWLLWCKTFVWT